MDAETGTGLPYEIGLPDGVVVERMEMGRVTFRTPKPLRYFSVEIPLPMTCLSCGAKGHKNQKLPCGH
ncbi:protein of unknown function [Ralstonia solanacearum CMR15]|nr:protein of unknown function [Ralstonia solanacearum CMR15]